MFQILLFISLFCSRFYVIFSAKDEFISFQRNDDSIPDEILEDAKLTVPEIIKKYGYPVEVHHVTTNDGYILEMHRIPNPGAQPVYLQHGLLDSSATWIIMGTQQGLGYMLHDRGYDVWMGNTRGNTYSKNHTRLAINTEKFWNFSFNELGVHDLPAMIDYILEKTGYKKLHYVGHSQGTTSFWAMGSKRPKYNEKILSMQALAPIAYLNQIRSPLFIALIDVLNIVQSASDIFGLYQFLPNNKFLIQSGQKLCQDEAMFQSVCKNVLFLAAGYDSKQLNSTMLPILVSHAPAGASIKQVVHYGQIARSGIFREYDYGYFINWSIYGSIRPREYDISKITAPVIFHYSKNDWLAGVDDVEKFYRMLPNTHGKYLISMPKFNHLDFVWAIDAREYVYEKVLEILKKFDKEK